jgi:replicative DNA helicase Mcm
VDPETGEIDIEVMEGRTPTSEREKMQKVMEEIGLLEEEFGNQAPLNVLVSNMAEKFDMSEDKVESIVRNLNQKGLIYIPSTGYLKRA